MSTSPRAAPLLPWHETCNRLWPSAARAPSSSTEQPLLSIPRAPPSSAQDLPPEPVPVAHRLIFCSDRPQFCPPLSPSTSGADASRAPCANLFVHAGSACPLCLIPASGFRLPAWSTRLAALLSLDGKAPSFELAAGRAQAPRPSSCAARRRPPAPRSKVPSRKIRQNQKSISHPRATSSAFQAFAP